MADRPRGAGPGFHLSNTSAAAPERQGWQIDRHISLAVVVTVVVALIGYAASVFWFVADQSSRVVRDEQRIQSLEDGTKDLLHIIAGINDKLGLLNDKAAHSDATISDKLAVMNERAARQEERSLYVLDRLQIPASTPQPASLRRGGTP